MVPDAYVPLTPYVPSEWSGHGAPQGTSRKPESGPDRAGPPSVHSLVSPSSLKQGEGSGLVVVGEEAQEDSRRRWSVLTRVGSHHEQKRGHS